MTIEVKRIKSTEVEPLSAAEYEQLRPSLTRRKLMALYHKDVFLPKKIRGQVPGGVKSLVWSNHAKRAAMTDRYGKINVTTTLNFSECEVIEVEHYKSGVAKLVLRLTKQGEHDTIFVVSPEAKQWVVRTVWLNHKDDKHATLDSKLYAKAG